MQASRNFKNQWKTKLFHSLKEEKDIFNQIGNQTFSSNKGSSQIDIQNEIFEGNLKLCFNGLILTE